MIEQRSLFDVERTQPAACRVPGCGAIRTVGQDKVPTCMLDRERAIHGTWTPRPSACLNVYKPEHAEIPY